MTDLDSILESRDITLPRNVPVVKAMVFPVVMYGCESWTTEKAEHQIIDAFKNLFIWMLGAGALGRPRGMVCGGRREEGSGWGTHVYLWRIHFDIWQN